MKNINQEELLKLKNKIRLNYSSVKSIYCPALDSRVIFNSDGFHHLCYDNNRSERSVLVQRNKLNAFKNVVKILSKTTTIQEYRSSYHFWSVMPFWQLSSGHRKIASKDLVNG